jgi:hypothetical protein
MNMTMKEHILAALVDEFDQWEEMLGKLNSDQRITPLSPSSWSTKDVIAHLGAWQQWSIARLEAAQEGRLPEFPKWPLDPAQDHEGVTDRINEWIFQTYRDRTWVEVHQDWRQGFQHFLELAVPIPEKDLLDDGKYVWLKGHPLADVLIASYDHHQEHYEKTMAWLKKHDMRP